MSLQLILICSKCGKRVPREACVIDDYGEAVHDLCAIATRPRIIPPSSKSALSQLHVMPDHRASLGPIR